MYNYNTTNIESEYINEYISNFYHTYEKQVILCIKE